MSKRDRHHYIAEHMWRALRALVLLIASAVWIYTDSTHLVLGLLFVASLIDQFHGFICKSIQHMLGWTEDFSDWE